MALCMCMCVDLHNGTITTNQHRHGAPAARGCQWPFITQGHKDFKLVIVVCSQNNSIQAI